MDRKWFLSPAQFLERPGLARFATEFRWHLGSLQKSRATGAAGCGPFRRAATGEPNEFDGFLILTTAANEVARPIHNRMPVIVKPEMYDAWLDPKSTQDVLKEIVEHPRNDELTVYEVSPLVNNARNERAECIAPVHKTKEAPAS